MVPQELNLDAFFTAREALDIQAGMYGVPKAERRTDEILARIGLTDKADAYARSLSGGMRRRLLVGKAMVHNPPVLVLDEPTAGVDIELRQQLWNEVRKLNREGVTVVITTHYLEEAEELCDRIAIINHGKLVACESKETLLRRIAGKTLKITLAEPVAMVPPALSPFEPELQEGGRLLVLQYRPSRASRPRRPDRKADADARDPALSRASARAFHDCLHARNRHPAGRSFNRTHTARPAGKG